MTLFWFRDRTKRLRISFSGHGKPVVEIFLNQPLLIAKTFQQAVIPHPGGRDVELSFSLLIDRLHSNAGDSPLPANPVDVAMQRHLDLRPCKALARPSKDSGVPRLRNIEPTGRVE